MMHQETIIAISSAPGQAWRGLIRLSGPLAFDVLTVLCDQSEVKHGVMQRAEFTLGNHPLSGLYVFCQSPRSFTGEDLIEIQLPGHPVLLQRFVEQCLELAKVNHWPLRMAEAGEFTQRAFLAGRIDLTQAEGIAATINARTDAQLHAGHLLKHGQLGDWASSLVDTLAMLLALVEAGIDFTEEEDVVPISPRDLSDGLTVLHEKLEEMLKHARSWAQLDALPRVVLVGLPNAGKSTLFNAMIGDLRVVSSPEAGTTRDIITHVMPLTLADGREAECLLVDVAGLEQAKGEIGTAMQQQARDAIDHADLVLLLQAPNQAAPAIEIHQRVIHVKTMCDLEETDAPNVIEQDGVISISAITKVGLNELRSLIAKHLSEQVVVVSGELIALQPRHEDALKKASAYLFSAIEQLAPFIDDHALADIELLANDLRLALDELAGLGGQMSPDDVLGKIFSSFCVGK